MMSFRRVVAAGRLPDSMCLRIWKRALIWCMSAGSGRPASRQKLSAASPSPSMTKCSSIRLSNSLS